MLDKIELAEVTAMIAEAAAIAAVKAIQEAKFVSDQDHYNHHNWIAAKIKSEEARAAFFVELTKHVAKWGTIGVISALFYGLWLVAKESFKRG